MIGPTLRLAYVCGDPGIPPDGSKGASVHFRELAAALRRAGADVDVFMARESLSDGDRRSGTKVYAPRRSRGVAGEVRQLANSAAMLDGLAASGPHDAVYERLSLFGIAGFAYARATRIPFVLEVNAPLWEESARYRSLGLAQSARAIATETIRSADHVLVVSRELARVVEAEGADPGRVHVVPNGVNHTLFEAAMPARRPHQFERRPMILFVGSLKPWHGIELLLEAVPIAGGSDSRPGLWIVGDGPLRAEVERVRQRFPDDVVLEGPVDHERIPGILAAADVVVAPYASDAPHYFCPLKVVEAIAARRPLVASRVPCVLGTLRDLGVRESDIELFEPDDRNAFSAAIVRALAAPARRHDESPPRAIPAELTWEAKARQVLRLVGTPERRRQTTERGQG